LGPSGHLGRLGCSDRLFALFIAGAFLVPPQRSVVAFVTYIIAISVVLTAICWWKGEPPKWRWGDDR